MMKKLLFAVIIAAVCVSSSFAQKSEEKAVISVVNRLFDQMAAANADGIRSTMTSDPQLVAIAKMPDGKTRLSVIGLDQFTKFFTKPGAVEEILYEPKVKMDGDWAMVWGRYVFFADGELSHCGVDQFNLTRTESGWKIVNGTFTIDKDSCTKAEKAIKPSVPGKKK